MQIARAQIKMIHCLKNALQLDDPTYRQALENRFHVSTSKDLTSFQAEELIRELKEIAVSAGRWTEQPPGKKKYEEWEGRCGMASAPQLRKIEIMWREVSRIDDQEGRKKALRSILERIAKVSDLRFLDAGGAGKVINALNAMRKRKAA